MGFGEQYSKLTAAELAERIGVAMGWVKRFRKNGSHVFVDAVGHAWGDSWHPAESWSDAGKLMDLMIANGWRFDIRSPVPGTIDYCVTTRMTGTGRYEQVAYSHSGPRAIAEAICAALEAEKR